MVAAEARVASKSLANLRLRPSQGPLHQPALGQDGKAAGAGLALDDLEPQTLLCCSAGRGLALVAAIGEDQAEPGEAPAQPAADQRQPIAILDVGGVDDDHQQQAQGVDQNVALAAVDLLAGVIASGPAGFGGPHALAVDDASGRRGLPAGPLARRHDQLGVQYLPGSILPPAPEIAEHRALGRQLLGQEVPGAAGAQQIEDGVQDLAQVHLPWPPEPARCRSGRLCSVSPSAHTGAGRTRSRASLAPHGLALRYGQPADSAQIFSEWALRFSRSD